MKGMLTVFGFTFRDQVRKKSYIISTVILVVLVVAALCAPVIINRVKSGQSASSSKEQTGNGTVYVIDDTGITDGGKMLKSVLSGYRIETAKLSDQTRLTGEIKNSADKVLIILKQNGSAISFDYYVKSLGDGPDADELAAIFKNLNTRKVLAQNAVPAAVTARVISGVTYQTHQAGKGMLTGFVPAIAVSILLFMCIYMYGYWVAMSIASEKTSRVMELLITSTKPSKIVIGKSIAMGLLGLIQLLAVIIAAAVTYRAAYPKNFDIGGLTLNFSGFTPFYTVIMVLYFLLGFALYAMINAVAGATVSNAEDVRTAITPISIIAVLSFYFAYGTIMFPDSTAAVAASVIPFSAPFSMPSRILMAEVPVWQIAASFALLAAATALMAWISIRLYSSAVLHYGKKLKLSELFAMSKNQ